MVPPNFQRNELRAEEQFQIVKELLRENGRSSTEKAIMRALPAMYKAITQKNEQYFYKAAL